MAVNIEFVFFSVLLHRVVWW